MKMKRIPFLDRDVSPVLMGTMPLFSGDLGEHFNHLDMTTEMGVNILDTAIGYGGAEVSIGKWMTARKNRKDVVVITKGCHRFTSKLRIPERVVIRGSFTDT